MLSETTFSWQCIQSVSFHDSFVPLKCFFSRFSCEKYCSLLDGKEDYSLLHFRYKAKPSFLSHFSVLAAKYTILYTAIDCLRAVKSTTLQDIITKSEPIISNIIFNQTGAFNVFDMKNIGLGLSSKWILCCEGEGEGVNSCVYGSIPYYFIKFNSTVFWLGFRP